MSERTAAVNEMLVDLRRHNAAANQHDATLVLSLLMDLQAAADEQWRAAGGARGAAAAPRLEWGLDFGEDTATDRCFGVRVRAGAPLLRHSDVRDMRARSERVLGVRVLTSRARFVVLLLYAAATAAAAVGELLRYAPPRKRRAAPALRVDWAAGGVRADEDVRLCEALVRDVYNYAERMPATVRFWFERIAADGRAQRRAGRDAPAPPPLLDDSFISADDDGARTEDTDDDAAAAAAPLGWALCFAGMPDVLGDFLRHLCDAHGPRVTAAYVWLRATAPAAGNNEDGAVLVVNVHSALAVAGARAPVTAPPLGLHASAKRRRA